MENNKRDPQEYNDGILEGITAKLSRRISQNMLKKFLKKFKFKSSRHCRKIYKKRPSQLFLQYQMDAWRNCLGILKINFQGINVGKPEKWEEFFTII